jgi:hypothetical protein
MPLDETLRSAFSALIFRWILCGSLSHALKGTVTSFLKRPFAPLSVLATFFGRSSASPSSLFRFLSSLVRNFSAGAIFSAILSAIFAVGFSF